MTQGEIEQLPEEVVEIFGSLEKRIMNDIVRRIRINGFSTASADWQVNRLHQLGESEDQIREWTAEALTLSEKELDEIFSDAVYNEFMGHDRAYRVMGKPRVPYKSNMQLQSLVAAIKAQTKGTFENITQTLAVGAKGADGRVILTPLMNFYRETLDNAVLDIESGAFDYQRVLMRTVKVLKNSGIRTITYDHGPSIRVDAAVRRAVLTGFRQVQEKINEQTAADLGTDYYEVSYHVGARPTHQPWQGRVYSWKDLHDICGLGTVTGLHGANCYHDYNAFIPGVSVRTYTDEQLDQMIDEENTPKEYAGKEYTTYEALQEQRKLERNARATREEIMMLQEGGSNKDELILAKARYQGILQVYDDFSEKMGLPTQHERIYLDGLKGKFTPERKVSEERQILLRKIVSGEITITLNAAKQEPHMEATKEEGKSYFTIDFSDIQNIINEKHGTGRIIISSAGQIKEILDAGKEVGYNIPIGEDGKAKEPEKTKYILVHYSKRRTHAVPANPNQE